jgi:hypothetical protein
LQRSLARFSGELLIQPGSAFSSSILNFVIELHFSEVPTDLIVAKNFS